MSGGGENCETEQEFELVFKDTFLREVFDFNRPRSVVFFHGLIIANLAIRVDVIIRQAYPGVGLVC